jgi:predicted Co/Zn/Cd cation transporter (cation efflux family)
MTIIPKTQIIITLMGVGMGLLAGLLVAVFDLTPYRTALLIILALLVLTTVALMFVAYKKGRLKRSDLFRFLA